MKKQFIIFLVFIFSVLCSAQETGNNIQFNIGSGMHGLVYTLQNGSQEFQPGYAANVEFSHFFGSFIGVQTGIGVQTYSSISTLNLTENTPAEDSDGDSYIFISTFNNWKESQQVLSIEVPLTAQFKHYINDKTALLLIVGTKISIPLSVNYKTTGGEIVTSGYYPQYNIELTDLPQHGFSTITHSYSGKYRLYPSYMIIAELGETYFLSERNDLYLGVYFNYGLNSMLKPDTKMLYQIDGILNGVLETYQTSSVKPFSIGVKLGLFLKL